MAQRILRVTVVLVCALTILSNARALYEGVFFYLRDALTYDARAVTPINRAGRYASVYDLAALRNAERLAYLQRYLAARALSVTPIAIPNSSFPNLFVRLNATTEPYTIFCAHYDKLYDDAEYHGASDNTAAVSVLLAAIDALARRGDASPRAFLFTGEEETGLRGAHAFAAYARANALPIRAIVNVDNLGRGGLAIRPAAERAGFVITFPFVGEFAYDSRAINPSPAYALANATVARRATRAQPRLVVYERFTARSDANVFEANGFDTVTISSDNLYYLETTWHTYADRVEWLDEGNLDLLFNLILRWED